MITRALEESDRESREKGEAWNLEFSQRRASGRSSLEEEKQLVKGFYETFVRTLAKLGVNKERAHPELRETGTFKVATESKTLRHTRICKDADFGVCHVMLNLEIEETEKFYAEMGETVFTWANERARQMVYRVQDAHTKGYRYSRIITKFGPMSAVFMMCGQLIEVFDDTTMEVLAHYHEEHKMTITEYFKIVCVTKTSRSEILAFCLYAIWYVSKKEDCRSCARMTRQSILFRAPTFLSISATTHG